MTDQKKDLCEEDYHGINAGLIFCIICFVLAVLIFLAGGSALFALILGAVSIAGIFHYFVHPFHLSGGSGGVDNLSHYPTLGEEAQDPQHRSLSINIHNPDRNPSFEWEDRND